MRLLIDTHILVWSMDLLDLPPAIATLLIDPAHEILVSPVSVTEIAIKHRQGLIPTSPREAIEHIGDARLTHAPYTAEAAARVAELPPHHRDPFDHMLLAHALTLGAALVSVDREIALYATLLPIIGPTGAILGT